MIQPTLYLPDTLPEIDKREVMRYASSPNDEGELDAILDGCIREAKDAIKPKVVYALLPTVGGSLKIGEKEIYSEKLLGCERAVVFAATIGSSFDRLVGRYSEISPVRALFLQSLGAERVEALCDLFCRYIEDALYEKSRPRFSPGYRSLPLDVQKDILALLDAYRLIGITLNESLLISPTKSVTAIMGLKKEKE